MTVKTSAITPIVFDFESACLKYFIAGKRPKGGRKKEKKLEDDIEKWAGTSGKNQITTLQIRNQVLSELGKINEFAANAFLWYEKTKDHGLNSGE